MSIAPWSAVATASRCRPVRWAAWTCSCISPRCLHVYRAWRALFIHPGPAARLPVREAPLGDPLWWPALTRYVAEMHAAWLVFGLAARRLFPELRVSSRCSPGLPPLHSERLRARGGPEIDLADPLTFYDTSCNGSYAISLMDRLASVAQLVYGSDRPVVDPGKYGVREVPDWERLRATRGACSQMSPSASRWSGGGGAVLSARSRRQSCRRASQRVAFSMKAVVERGLCSYRVPEAAICVDRSSRGS